jgi:glucose/mannose transport system substrate-binding protein
MRKLSRRQIFSLSVPLPFLLSGCAGDDEHDDDDGDGGSDDGSTSKHTVELFSWWIAQSEADALQALIDLHTVQYPNEKVYNAAVESGATAKMILAERLADNQPPDIYQENAYNIPRFLESNPDGLVPLSDFFEEEGLLDVVVPEVIENVTFDGEIVAMPVNIHRENALHYNIKVFEELKLDVPTSLEELLSTCEALKAAGVTPLAVSHQGWITRLLFNSLLSASMGPEAYKSFFLGESELDEDALRAGFDLLDEVLQNYVNASASDPDFGWTQAADLLLEGEAAMFIHGDWAKGYLQGKGMEPGVGFGVAGMPGAADFFLYGVDVFAILKGGPEPEASKHFLRTVSSKQGQTKFNKLKGSSPIRLDVDTDELDVIAQSTLEELRNAKLRMLTRSKAEWDMAIHAFTVDRDQTALMQAYIDNPPSKSG